MIKFASLLSAIQNAAEEAAHMVSEKNLEFFKTYFHSSKDGHEKGDDPSGTEELTPRMVDLKYPIITADGPKEHTVSVPLLSVVPVSRIEVADVQIEMDLEILSDDDELIVGFPQKEKTIFGDKVVAPKPNAKVIINVKASERPAGVSSIIEGYDKALRAQIPG